MYSSAIENLAKTLSLMYSHEDNLVYGHYNGYNCSITLNTQTDTHYICFSIYQKENININLIDNLSPISKLIVDKKYDGNNLIIAINKGITLESSIEDIRKLLDDITTLLDENSFINCCENCGENYPVQMYSINNSPCFFCDTCHTNLTNQLQAIKSEVNNEKSNVLLGTIGSILGSLIGVILWIIISMAGYIAAIVGFVTAFCSIKGYKLFGGKLNKVGITITVIVTIVMVFVANYLSLSYQIYDAFISDAAITIFDAIKSVPTFLSDSVVSKDFFTNLGIGYIFTLFASISTFRNSYKSNNVDLSIRTINGIY